jgi:hypothetical protein
LLAVCDGIQRTVLVIPEEGAVEFIGAALGNGRYIAHFTEFSGCPASFILEFASHPHQPEQPGFYRLPDRLITIRDRLKLFCGQMKSLSAPAISNVNR